MLVSDGTTTRRSTQKVVKRSSGNGVAITVDSKYEDIDIGVTLQRLPKFFLRLVSKSASYANEKEPEGWEISFRPKGSPPRLALRLNIGHCRAIDLLENPPALGIELDGEHLTDRDKRLLNSLSIEIVPDPLEKLPKLVYVVLSRENFKEAWKVIEKAHKEFIDKALHVRHGRSTWWRYHSAEAVRHLCRILRSELPQPGYVKNGRDNGSDAFSEEVIRDRKVEGFKTQFSSVTGRAQYQMARSEARLLAEYARFLQTAGHKIGRKEIPIKGEKGRIRCDLYNYSRKQLVEAKGSTTRVAIRMAIGELADYRRYLPKQVTPAVLLPERPSRDLEDLLSTQMIAVIWQDGKQHFTDNAKSSFA
jgi:hypothetical protein